jgi:hypothetical protein
MSALIAGSNYSGADYENGHFFSCGFLRFTPSRFSIRARRSESLSASPLETFMICGPKLVNLFKSFLVVTFSLPVGVPIDPTRHYFDSRFEIKTTVHKQAEWRKNLAAVRPM